MVMESILAPLQELGTASVELVSADGMKRFWFPVSAAGSQTNWNMLFFKISKIRVSLSVRCDQESSTYLQLPLDTKFETTISTKRKLRI